MPRTISCVGLLVLLSVTLAPAQPAAPPKGPPPDPRFKGESRLNILGQDGSRHGMPPRLMTAIPDAQGRPTLRQRIVTYEITVREVEVKVDGRTEKRAVPFRAPVFQETVVDLTHKDVQVFHTDGKKVDPKELPKLIKKETPVLVSSDGEMVSRFYLNVIREGTLVVVLPGYQAEPIRGPLPAPKASPAPKKIPDDGRKLPDDGRKQ